MLSPFFCNILASSLIASFVFSIPTFVLYISTSYVSLFVASKTPFLSYISPREAEILSVLTILFSACSLYETPFITCKLNSWIKNIALMRDKIKESTSSLFSNISIIFSNFDFKNSKLAPPLPVNFIFFFIY